MNRKQNRSVPSIDLSKQPDALVEKNKYKRYTCKKCNGRIFEAKEAAVVGYKCPNCKNALTH